MEQHQQNRLSRIPIVLMGFVVLCAGILLASQWTGFATTTSSGSEELVAIYPIEATELALQDATRADLALREENFGEAQLHIQRARVRLESAVAAMQTSGQ